jgi:type 1 glutamine amidotransferase
MSIHRCLTVLGVWLALTAATFAAPLKALIVDGQNGHNWKETTPVIKSLLEKTGLFTVDVATSPAHGKDMSGFKPDFAAYNVVLLNYQGDDWPEATQKAFVDYVANGGGVVVYHFAAAAFPKWKQYNQIIGVGGWGNRNEKAGPYLVWRDGKVVKLTDPPGKAGFHGKMQPIEIVIRDAKHPITRGLPPVLVQPLDELYCRLRGPAEHVKVLATAFATKSNGGTDENEPIILTIKYGKGRVFATRLGHTGKETETPTSAVFLQRGAEWAATGKVTQEVPEGLGK